MVTRRSFFGQIGALAAAGPLLTEAALARQAHAAQATGDACLQHRLAGFQ